MTLPSLTTARFTPLPGTESGAVASTTPRWLLSHHPQGLAVHAGPLPQAVAQWGVQVWNALVYPVPLLRLVSDASCAVIRVVTTAQALPGRPNVLAFCDNQVTVAEATGQRPAVVGATITLIGPALADTVMARITTDRHAERLLKALWAHELGHALGLEHAAETGHLMSAGNQTLTQPTPADEQALRRLYGL